MSWEFRPPDGFVYEMTISGTKFSLKERTQHPENQELVRYSLTRVWSRDLPLVLFIMHNPATMCEQDDDITIKKCMKWASINGYGGLLVGNLLPFIKGNTKKDEILEEENRKAVRELINRCSTVVYAWSNKIKAAPDWLEKYIMQDKTPYCLGLSSDNCPLLPTWDSGKLILFNTGLQKSKP